MNDRIRTSLFIFPLLLLAFISEIFLFLFLLTICILIIYETNLNTKKYASSYGYDLYMNNYNNSNKYDTVSFDNMFGNTFTKTQTKNVFNYHTTRIFEDSNNSKINRA